MLSSQKSKWINFVMASAIFLLTSQRVTIETLYSIDNFILMTNIFTKLTILPTITSSLTRLNNIKLKITGWLNYKYTNSELLNEQTACTLGKGKQEENRSNESNGLPEINFLFPGGGGGGKEQSTKFAININMVYYQVMMSINLRFQLGIAVIIKNTNIYCTVHALQQN